MRTLPMLLAWAAIILHLAGHVDAFPRHIFTPPFSPDNSTALQRANHDWAAALQRLAAAGPLEILQLCRTVLADASNGRGWRTTSVAQTPNGTSTPAFLFPLQIYKGPALKLPPSRDTTGNADGPDHRFPCHRCQKNFRDGSDLQRHYREKHFDQFWLCPKCGKVLNRPDRFKNHFKGSCGSASPDGPRQMCYAFTCGICTPSKATCFLHFDGFISHVKDHWQNGSTRREWRWHTQVRALLQQGAFIDLWSQIVRASGLTEGDLLEATDPLIGGGWLGRLEGNSTLTNTYEGYVNDVCKLLRDLRTLIISPHEYCPYVQNMQEHMPGDLFQLYPQTIAGPAALTYAAQLDGLVPTGDAPQLHRSDQSMDPQMPYVPQFNSYYHARPQNPFNIVEDLGREGTSHNIDHPVLGGFLVERDALVEHLQSHDGLYESVEQRDAGVQQWASSEWDNTIDPQPPTDTGATIAVQYLRDTVSDGVFPHFTSGERNLCGLYALVGSINDYMQRHRADGEVRDEITVDQVYSAMFNDNYDPTPEYITFVQDHLRTLGIQRDDPTYGAAWYDYMRPHTLGIQQLVALPEFLARMGLLQQTFTVGVVIAATDESGTPRPVIPGHVSPNSRVIWIYNDNGERTGDGIGHWMMFVQGGDHRGVLRGLDFSTSPTIDPAILERDRPPAAEPLGELAVPVYQGVEVDADLEQDAMSLSLNRWDIERANLYAIGSQMDVDCPDSSPVALSDGLDFSPSPPMSDASYEFDPFLEIGFYLTPEGIRNGRPLSDAYS